jgi:hypothetical protein
VYVYMCVKDLSVCELLYIVYGHAYSRKGSMYGVIIRHCVLTVHIYFFLYIYVYCMYVYQLYTYCYIPRIYGAKHKFEEYSLYTHVKGYLTRDKRQRITAYTNIYHKSSTRLVYFFICCLLV